MRESRFTPAEAARRQANIIVRHLRDSRDGKMLRIPDMAAMMNLHPQGRAEVMPVAINMMTYLQDAVANLCLPLEQFKQLENAEIRTISALRDSLSLRTRQRSFQGLESLRIVSALQEWEALPETPDPHLKKIT